MSTRPAYQLAGAWPRYVRPPPVDAARVTCLPVELDAIFDGDPITGNPGVITTGVRKTFVSDREIVERNRENLLDGARWGSEAG